MIFRNNIYSRIFTFTIFSLIFFNISKGYSSEDYFWDNFTYYLFRPFAYVLPHFEQRKTIYKDKSDYSDIRVEVDEQGRRHLVFLPRHGSQSVYDPGRSDKMVSNVLNQMLLALPALERKPKKVLFLGLGGGIMPMYIRNHYPDAQIDSIEIDYKVLEVAERFFGFKLDSKMNIFLSDGRDYIKKTKQKYDIVFLDVYDAKEIPPQFTTVEFFREVKKCLAHNGVLSINLANLGKKGFIPAELNTISHVFPNKFISVSKGNTNYVPICLADDNVTLKDLKKNSLLLDKFKLFTIKFNDLVRTIVDRRTLKDLIGSSDVILTDNK